MLLLLVFMICVLCGLFVVYLRKLINSTIFALFVLDLYY